MELKKCTKCGQYLTLDKFCKKAKAKDGLNPSCKECEHKKKKEYYKKNADLIKEKANDYRIKNQDAVKERKKKYYNENKESISAKNKIYRTENCEQLSQKYKEYYQNNKEKIMASNMEWQAKNQDLVKEYKRKNYDTNKDKYRENANSRYHTEEGKIKHQIRMKRYSQTEKGRLTNVTKRARRKNKTSKLPSDYTREDWILCQNYFEHRCCYCGEELKLEQDHFVALSNGGEYTKNNIVPACKSCNSSKNNEDFFEWYKSKPFYSKQREQKILKYLNYKNKTQQLTLI